MPPPLIRQHRKARTFRRRHGRLDWFPPHPPAVPGPLVPPLIHRHRNARYRPHRGRHLLPVAPVLPPAPAPGLLFSAGNAWWKWSAGAARNS